MGETRDEVEGFLGSVRRWAAATFDVAGVLLVGSYARGEARPDSDVDLIILVEDRARYLTDRGWTESFGDVRSCDLEYWGAVTSLRVKYVSGLEVEFSLAHVSWASREAVDPGTRRVLDDGYRVLHDPSGLFDGLEQR